MSQVMSENQREALLKQVEQGHRARKVSDAAGTMFDERKEKIIEEAIGVFRDNNLDGGTAVRYWAALAEVILMKQSLEYEDRLGSRATEILVSEPKTAD